MTTDSVMPRPEVRVHELRTFWQRLRGLLGQPAPAQGEAVWLKPCRQVHTWGMAYAIDVVHLDESGRVLAVQTLPPWRLGTYVAQSRSILELRAGEAERLGLIATVIPSLLATQGRVTEGIISRVQQ